MNSLTLTAPSDGDEIVQIEGVLVGAPRLDNILDMTTIAFEVGLGLSGVITCHISFKAHPFYFDGYETNHLILLQDFLGDSRPCQVEVAGYLGGDNTLLVTLAHFELDNPNALD